MSESSKKRLHHIVAPHVDSYNYFLDHGLAEATEDIPLMEFNLGEDYVVRMKYMSAEVEIPKRIEGGQEIPITPHECRDAGSTYAGAFTANIQVEVEGKSQLTLLQTVSMGELPVMVKSRKCHLYEKTSKQLVRMKEETNEMGGYFIMNGLERLVRLLQVQRRNFPLVLERGSFKNRGTSYSDKGIIMRCTRGDNSSKTITLHYLNNGGATLRFNVRKQEYLVPVVMIAKALMNISDQELFSRIVSGDVNNTFLTTRLELLLRDFKAYNLRSMEECQEYLGSLFRSFLPISAKTSDLEAGKMLIRQYVFVHLDSFPEKLDCLIFLIRKLFTFVEGKCLPDNADAMCNHELLLPGQLFGMYVKEKMEEALLLTKMMYLRDYNVNKKRFDAEILDSKYHQKQLDRSLSPIGRKIGNFISTGNFVTSSGMDLSQLSGMTIIAERLNFFRYCSHFQSVHRGQYFTTMKTTTVRKLLPESWGFLCPVHTPDGGPCGLLNHLAKDAVVVTYPPVKKTPFSPHYPINYAANANKDLLNSKAYLQEMLSLLGMKPSGMGNGDGQVLLSTEYLPVMKDGGVIGGIHKKEADAFVKKLRYIKSLSHQGKGGNAGIPFILDPTMEIAYFPANDYLGPYPCLLLQTMACRMIRPVMNLHSKSIEWIGPMEQQFMNIACLKEDLLQDPDPQNLSQFTHMELSPTTMFSHIASLTPYSDYNQSPRNMYQCQMGKQTMGTPAHAIQYRTDNKLYRVQNVQAPLVQTQSQAEYCMDEYPHGCNAVVAVISYTGYDMEDAMIINKGAFERGFGYGSVYKTKFFDLDEEEKRFATLTHKPAFKFANMKVAGLENVATAADANATNLGTKIVEELDIDGLPLVGTLLKEGDPMFCLIDTTTGEHRVITHHDAEAAYVQAVRIVGPTASSGRSARKQYCREVNITLRYPRRPIIGDKFSSRHGQKGTLSVLWPQENMPFSEYGMSPDVLINPHAFPSRMTIGMLVESMAGKSAAVHGEFQDATPFQFHEENRVVDHIGDQLKACGFNYYGSEPLYNGLTGQIMEAEIFMGLVFYQRLRHMVSDKSQVRATGKVTALTRQPVKGRSHHGGIRLGEMERDALLSHGVSFCLQDRLMNCSDAHLAYVCGQCGGLLSVCQQPLVGEVGDMTLPDVGGGLGGMKARYQQACRVCKTADHVRPVVLPYVFRYLSNELAAMGIKMSLELKDL
eukprot:gene6155-4419_t